MLLGVEDLPLMLLLWNLVFTGECVDSSHTHIELLHQFGYAIPLCNRVIGFVLQNVLVDMFLAPVGLAHLEDSRDMLLSPYFINPTLTDIVFVLDFLDCVELGDVFGFCV